MIPFSAFTPRMWAAVVVTGLGVLFGIISLASTSWNDFSHYTLGLWKLCTTHVSTCEDSNRTLTDAMKVGRALVLMGSLAWLLILVLLFVYVLKVHPGMVLVSIITGVVCACLMLLGAILWSAGLSINLSWGYYLCYVSGILAAALSVLLFLMRNQLLMEDIISST